MSRIETLTLPHLGDIPLVIQSRQDIAQETPPGKLNEKSLGWGYWDRIWPSEMALSEFLIQEFFPEQLQGRRVLELGCGVGLAGVVAARLGAFTMFSDLVPIALKGVRETCELNHICNFHTCLLDWTSSIKFTEQYDIILGSDVFYAPKNLPGISHVLDTLLKPGGQAFFSDPGRLGIGAIEFYFQKRFVLSVESCAFNESLREITGGKKTGFIYKLIERTASEKKGFRIKMDY